MQGTSPTSSARLAQPNEFRAAITLRGSARPMHSTAITVCRSAPWLRGLAGRLLSSTRVGAGRTARL
eukprot:4870257-Alexandrium_andersonii.AAC.1